MTIDVSEDSQDQNEIGRTARAGLSALRSAKSEVERQLAKVMDSVYTAPYSFLACRSVDPVSSLSTQTATL